MQTSRRGFLGFLLAAPVVIATPELLMPVRSIATPTISASTLLDLMGSDYREQMEQAIIDLLITGNAMFHTSLSPEGMQFRAISPPSFQFDPVL